MASDNETYDMLLKLVKTRHSVRKFKPDPIPEDTIDKILEVALGDVGRQLATVGVCRCDRSQDQKRIARRVFGVQHRLDLLDGTAA